MALKPIQSKPGEPIWEIARQYPNQGEWREADYFAFETNHFVEYDNGYRELLCILSNPSLRTTQNDIQEIPT